jgi:hypothetical protein
VLGRYLAKIYLIDHDTCEKAYNTLSLIAALLLSAGLAMFLVPAGNLEDWEEWEGTKMCVCVSSGWCMLFCLLVILFSWAIMSLINRVPKKDFRTFVLKAWVFFGMPIFMLNVAVFMLLCCFASLAYRIYGAWWAAFGFSWSCIWLLFLLAKMGAFMHIINKLDSPEHHEEYEEQVRVQDARRGSTPRAAAPAAGEELSAKTVVNPLLASA